MNYTNSRTFNPEILYAFDPWNEETHLIIVIIMNFWKYLFF